jgi:hypothetical protein
MMGWELITQEQHRAIAGLIRGRTKFLIDNPLDMRERHKPKVKRFCDIYDFIGDEVIATYGSKIGTDTQTILKHFESHPIDEDLPSATHDSIALAKFIFQIAHKLNFKLKALNA